MKAKILYVIDQLSIGGAEKQLIRLLKHLDRRRFDPHLWVLHGSWELLPEVRHLGPAPWPGGRQPGGPGHTPAEACPATGGARPGPARLGPARPGIPCRCLGVTNIFSTEALIRALSLVKRIRLEGYDILHTYLFASNIYGALLGAWAGVPVRISSRREIVDWKDFRHLLVSRLANRATHRITAVSRAVRESVLRREKVDPRKVVVIYNGVELPEGSLERRDSRLRERLGLPSGVPLVANLGGLKPIKDQATFVQACRWVHKFHPRAHFLIMGELREPVRTNLERLRQRYGLQDVLHILPPERDLAGVYRSIDVLVSSSVAEGFSNVILEAMSYGIPIVATDVGGNREAVAPRKTGYLVPPREPQAMAAAVLYLLQDPDRRWRMGQRAVRRVREHFSVEAMVRRYEALYEELLKESR